MKNPFRKTEIVEVPSGVKPPDPSAEQSIATLAHHPGFLELMKRLSLQKAVLETKLKRDAHKDIVSVVQLQSGLFWLEYLEREIEKRVHKTSRPAPIRAKEEDLEEFSRIHSALEKIGPA